MNNKYSRILWNYIKDTESSLPDVYLIHYIDENGERFKVKQIEWDTEERAYLFTLDTKDFIQMWGEEIDDSQIFVYKMINWNKI